MVNEGVAPEYGTPTTDGLRAIPGTGVKTLKGGLSNRASSSLCRGGIGGVGGGPLRGTLIVRTCRLKGIHGEHRWKCSPLLDGDV